jgi:hypothetical protein
MKLKTESEIAEAKCWLDQRVALNHESYTKEGDAKSRTRTDALEGFWIYKKPHSLTAFLDNLGKGFIPLDRANNTLCELAALYLEHGELPPEPLPKYVAGILRLVLQNNKQRGDLTYRDGEIVCMLLQLEKWGFPLFPNPGGPREGQTYACDMVVDTFKDAGISSMARPTVKGVWKRWKRHPQVRDFRKKK